MKITNIFRRKKSYSDKVIKEIYEAMDEYYVDSEEYDDLLALLERAYDLKEKETIKINPETLIFAGTNILGILLILKHEKINVITTKALSFIMRRRV